MKMYVFNRKLGLIGKVTDEDKSFGYEVWPQGSFIFKFWRYENCSPVLVDEDGMMTIQGESCGI